MEILQIASMTTKDKNTVLFKITICEHLDKGSSKSEIIREYKITVLIYFLYHGTGRIKGYCHCYKSFVTRLTTQICSN